MKTRFETAKIKADPAKVALLSQNSILRLVVVALEAGGTDTFSSVFLSIVLSLQGIVDGLIQVRPEDLILGVFNIAEVILFDGKNEKAHACEAQG